MAKCKRCKNPRTENPYLDEFTCWECRTLYGEAATEPAPPSTTEAPPTWPPWWTLKPGGKEAHCSKHRKDFVVNGWASRCTSCHVEEPAYIGDVLSRTRAREFSLHGCAYHYGELPLGYIPLADGNARLEIGGNFSNHEALVPLTYQKIVEDVAKVKMRLQIDTAIAKMSSDLNRWWFTCK